MCDLRVGSFDLWHLEKQYVTLEHKTSLKSLGYILAIAKNTLYGPNLSIFL